MQELIELGLIEHNYEAVYDDAKVPMVELVLLADTFNKNFKPTEAEILAAGDDKAEARARKRKKYYENIELDNDRFQEFAFATHPDAYDPKKMQILPLKDLIRIALTPDIKEWFGEGWWMTLKQAILVATNYDLKEIRRIISEFDLEDVKIFLDELWENIFN